MPKTIEIIVNNDGSVEYETKGMKGKSCIQESAWIDELFGRANIKSDVKTKEAHLLTVSNVRMKTRV